MVTGKMDENGVYRDEHGRFQKGTVGISPGRPAVSKAFKERCREFMNEEGWLILERMAREKGKEQLPALTLIANYAYGKPTQPVSGDDDMPPIQIATRIVGMTDEEIDALLSSNK